MKNLLKYLSVSLAATVLLAACEKNQDFQQTVDKAPGLVYVLSGEGNFNSVVISLKESEAEGSFTAEFPVQCNAAVHPAQQVNVVYSKEAVEAYNAANGTSYSPLPEEFLSIASVTPANPAEKEEGETEGEEGTEETPVEAPVLPASSSAVIPLAENALRSTDKVQVSLTGNLNDLEPGKYLVPVTVSSDQLQGSNKYGTFYLEVLAEQNLLTEPSGVDELSGMAAWGKSGWVSATDLENILTVDLNYERMVTTLILAGSADVNAIEYSVDGTAWKQAGTPVSKNYVSNGGRYYIPFLDYLNGGKDYIKARYIRMHVNGNVTDVDILEKDVDSDAPVVYFACGNDNVLETVLHTSEQFGNLYFDKPSFGLNVEPAAESEITGTVSVDNSLVDAFNSANGTAYSVVPEENVSLSGVELSIAAGSKLSSGETVFTLTGDLSGLSDANGYLVPLILNTSAAKSEKRSTVYVIVKPEVLTALIKPVTSTADMVGSQIAASTRRNFTADVPSAANLFDNRTNSYVSFDKVSGNVVTVDMKAEYNFSGINVRGYSYVYPLIEKLEISSDGVTFTDLGEVGEDNFFSSGTQCYASLYFGVAARYVRVTFGMEAPYWDYGYHVIAEIYIYEQQ